MRQEPHFRRWLVLVVAPLCLFAACGDEPSPRPARTTSPSPSPSITVAEANSVRVVGGNVPAGSSSTSLFDGLHLTGATSLPATALITGERYVVALTRVAVVRSFTTEQRAFLNNERTADGPLQAAPGQEFLVVGTDPDPPVKPSDADTPIDGAFTVDVGGAKQTLLLGQAATDAVIVVSVPIGADATLIATDRGKSNRISLRTGTVNGAKAPATSCRAPLSGTSAQVGYVLVGPGSQVTGALEVVVAQKAYVDGLGWARPGRCWLSVSWVSVGVIGTLEGIRGDFPTFAPVVADGRTLTPRGPAYDVPETTRSVRVSLGAGPLRTDQGPVRWVFEDTDAYGRSKPLTIPLR